MFASINIRSASSLQAAQTAGVMTVVIRTGVLRHLLEWGRTLVLGCPWAALKSRTVPWGMILCNWFVTCRSLAVSRSTRIPTQLRFFSWDAYKTLKKSCCLLSEVSGPGDQPMNVRGEASSPHLVMIIWGSGRSKYLSFTCLKGRLWTQSPLFLGCSGWETKRQTLPEEPPWWDKKVPGVCSRGQLRGARRKAQTG